MDCSVECGAGGGRGGRNEPCELAKALLLLVGVCLLLVVVETMRYGTEYKAPMTSNRCDERSPGGLFQCSLKPHKYGWHQDIGYGGFVFRWYTKQKKIGVSDSEAPGGRERPPGKQSAPGENNMASVQFKGFKCGDITKTLANGEFAGPALKALGVDTRGLSVIINTTRVDEADLNSYPLRDGDVVKATAKAIGGTDPEAPEAAEAATPADPAAEPAPEAKTEEQS